MFYVKGSAYLSSLSSTHPSQQASGQLGRSDNVDVQYNDRRSDKLLSSSYQSSLHHYNSYGEKAAESLALCILGAAILCILSVLYTSFLMPTILSATTLSSNGSENLPADSSDNPNGRGFDVPLQIGCPILTPRVDGGAKSVSDLRPDDIKVILGIGDSVMAGFGAKGIQNNRFISTKTLSESRGVSFAMGGDKEAITLPNIIHYYSPTLYGSSIGEQIFTVCFGDEFCPKGQYKKKIDVLNAAQSGARSSNLDHEIDYLIDRLDEAYSSNQIQPEDWKLLTLFIGSNDICHSCTTATSLPPPFLINVAAAVERIRLTIRNVLVQIVGVMRVDEIFVQTQNYPEYCQPFPRFSDFVLHDHECECAHTPANRTIMSTLTPQYNIGLQKIADTYVANDSFAVTFQPLKVDIMSFPIQAISNVDCFHPSEIGHRWFAKQLWRMMFLPTEQKQEDLKFDQFLKVYCPTDSDRFRVE